ncbi:MAG TPA: DUF1365 domain-containing protein, partial [Acidimicrobiales bacterium]|nr:DUF1365 domain-containing protein [Acidimicrobiales bacterium]
RAIYTGTVYHRRLGPGPARSFSYRVAMPFVDARDIGERLHGHPMWSSTHAAPVWLRRSDYFGDPGRPLDEEIRDLVQDRQGLRPQGPVMVLAHPRTWGWSFNPITLYFCFDSAGTCVEYLVADVENTPWHERHQYVMGAPGEHVMAKAMHVSPFLPMDLRYRVSYGPPRESLAVRFDVEGNDGTVFVAVLSLQRQPFKREELTKLMTRYPFMAHKVSAGIYSQAARLAMRGAPFYPHPRHGMAAQPPVGNHRSPGTQTGCPRDSR